jgi:cytoskeletal protein RodZ
MALSMDEQRMLAEIERRLAAEDPGLASCLTTFRRPSPATVLRSPRARIIGSLFTILVVAMVSLMVYAMIPFRAHPARNGPAFMPGGAFSAASGSQAPSIRDASASPSAKSSTTATAQTSSTAHSASPAAAKARESSTKQKNAGTTPAATP